MRNKGFTLIELVVVVIVLAILAIIAAPKFLDLKRDAVISDVKATAASFQQSLTFINTRWQIIGKKQSMNDMPGFANNDLDINDLGYPLGTDKGNPMGQPKNVGRGNAGCVDLWNALLENPPSVSLNNDGSDYQAYRHQNSAGDQALCTYVLRTLGDTAGRNSADIKIVYDSVAGTAKAEIAP